MEYKNARRYALIDVKQVYSQLEKGEIKYKSYKTRVKNIMRKYGSKYSNDGIADLITYADIKDKRYYIQSFVAGDFDFEFAIDINVVDFRYEDENNIDEIKEAGYTTKCLATCIYEGLMENFS
jgi:hypothetical protein